VIDAFDGSNNRFRAYAELWQWKYGLHVKDWRYAVRIANVDVSDMVAQTGNSGHHRRDLDQQADDPGAGAHPVDGNGNGVLPRQPHRERDALDRRDGQVPERALVRAWTQPVRHCGTGFGGRFGTGISGGRLQFMGVPVLTCDQILTTEAQIT
jgi:hypothetical protein